MRHLPFLKSFVAPNAVRTIKCENLWNCELFCGSEDREQRRTQKPLNEMRTLRTEDKFDLTTFELTPEWLNSTPRDQHQEPCLGKRVLVEKPTTIDELRMEDKSDSETSEFALERFNQTAGGVFGKESPGGDANDD
jgi:hypothetical protein